MPQTYALYLHSSSNKTSKSHKMSKVAPVRRLISFIPFQIPGHKERKNKQQQPTKHTFESNKELHTQEELSKKCARCKKEIDNLQILVARWQLVVHRLTRQNMATTIKIEPESFSNTNSSQIPIRISSAAGCPAQPIRCEWSANETTDPQDHPLPSTLLEFISKCWKAFSMIHPIKHPEFQITDRSIPELLSFWSSLQAPHEQNTLFYDNSSIPNATRISIFETFLGILIGSEYIQKHGSSFLEAPNLALFSNSQPTGSVDSPMKEEWSSPQKVRPKSPSLTITHQNNFLCVHMVLIGQCTTSSCTQSLQAEVHRLSREVWQGLFLGLNANSKFGKYDSNQNDNIELEELYRTAILYCHYLNLEGKLTAVAGWLELLPDIETAPCNILLLLALTRLDCGIFTALNWPILVEKTARIVGIKISEGETLQAHGPAPSGVGATPSGSHRDRLKSPGGVGSSFNAIISAYNSALLGCQPSFDVWSGSELTWSCDFPPSTTSQSLSTAKNQSKDESKETIKHFKNEKIAKRDLGKGSRQALCHAPEPAILNAEMVLLIVATCKNALRNNINGISLCNRAKCPGARAHLQRETEGESSVPLEHFSHPWYGYAQTKNEARTSDQQRKHWFELLRHCKIWLEERKSETTAALYLQTVLLQAIILAFSHCNWTPMIESALKLVESYPERLQSIVVNSAIERLELWVSFATLAPSGPIATFLYSLNIKDRKVNEIRYPSRRIRLINKMKKKIPQNQSIHSNVKQSQSRRKYSQIEENGSYWTYTPDSSGCNQEVHQFDIDVMEFDSQELYPSELQPEFSQIWDFETYYRD